ncbi:MAG: V-type ATPase 116kDa subunit family protein [Gallicola sp.]|nr:V-type ATPase 116kDa subunit family protein [Gallicola sp.]
MAVERMKLMSGIFLKKDASPVLREIILQGALHIAEKNKSSDFTIKAFERLNHRIQNKEEKPLSLSPFTIDQSLDSQKYKQQFNEIFDFLDLKKTPEDQIPPPTLCDEDLSEVEDLYRHIGKLRDRQYTIDNELMNLQLYADFLEFFIEKGADTIKIQDLKNLEFMNYSFGTLTQDAYKKLKFNYENMKDIVVHAGTTNVSQHNESEELIMVFSPLSKLSDSQNILKSLNFTPLDLPEFEFHKEETFRTLFSRIEKLLREKEEEKESFLQRKNDFAKQQEEKIRSLFYNYRIGHLSTQIEAYIAQSQHFIFITGFIPVSKIKTMKEALLKAAPESILSFEDVDIIKDLSPAPTKLTNNKFFAPFETLVNMYSVPNYREKDPTPFFAITYMLFFGMMFGDVGQGLILIIAGFLFAKKFQSLAGIARRVGASSMVFGFLYGSVFGIEDILPALLIRPMKDVNTTLLAAICIGVILILTAYIIGLGNLIKRKDRVNLLFDKNGITGLLFYLSFLIFILNIVFGKKYIPDLSPFLSIITIASMVVACFLLFMKPVLAKKFLSKEESSPIEESSGVERGFELFETIMSFFTNTLSFIRVGAFAINHVGLFMAFHALGQMTGSSIGKGIMLILGNIIIIVLEGLIVSIQAIRLEYYELFSRYFKGEGISYDPIHLKKY